MTFFRKAFVLPFFVSQTAALRRIGKHRRTLEPDPIFSESASGVGNDADGDHGDESGLVRLVNPKTIFPVQDVSAEELAAAYNAKGGMQLLAQNLVRKLYAKNLNSEFAKLNQGYGNTNSSLPIVASSNNSTATDFLAEIEEEPVASSSNNTTAVHTVPDSDKEQCNKTAGGGEIPLPDFQYRIPGVIRVVYTSSAARDVFDLTALADQLSEMNFFRTTTNATPISAGVDFEWSLNAFSDGSDPNLGNAEERIWFGPDGTRLDR
ncbi:unnamed protein product [Amoebophrya sp. A120]|nr:unnamed protein product [Amoebophrya sp. A120]|eukprot:GSA120T00002824001.1